jgi:hypothetical protein
MTSLDDYSDEEEHIWESDDEYLSEDETDDRPDWQLCNVRAEMDNLFDEYLSFCWFPPTWTKEDLVRYWPRKVFDCDTLNHSISLRLHVARFDLRGLKEYVETKRINPRAIRLYTMYNEYDDGVEDDLLDYAKALRLIIHDDMYYEFRDDLDGKMARIFRMKECLSLGVDALTKRVDSIIEYLSTFKSMLPPRMSKEIYRSMCKKLMTFERRRYIANPQKPNIEERIDNYLKQLAPVFVKHEDIFPVQTEDVSLDDLPVTKKPKLLTRLFGKR